MDHAPVEVELRPHGVQLSPGVAPVGRPIPALELIAEHEQIGQRMLLRLKGRLALLLVLIEGDGELEEAVVEQNGREGVQMGGGEGRGAPLLRQLLVEPGGGEIGVVHEVAVFVRIRGLFADDPF